MEAALVLEDLTAAEAIREYLLTVHEGNPYGFYKIWSQFKKRTSYQSARRYFWILKEIGLIEPVRFEASKAPFKKHLYRIVPGKEVDVRWGFPQRELYPSSALGKEYEKLKKRGLKPKGGRRRQYRK